jgi:hypothetical protein
MRGARWVATAVIGVALLGRGEGQKVPQVTRNAAAAPSYGPGRLLADLKDEAITESSGLAASRRSDTLFWTHNDSGDKPVLYATDREGRALARFTVTGATARDWEDIASGPGPGGPALYIGDIGDNSRNRHDVVVYRVPEPVVDAGRTGVVGQTAPAERFPYRYPDGTHDAETLMVHPRTGQIFVVSKMEAPPVVYRFPMPLRPGQQVTLERVAALSGVTPLITGGDIAPDGQRAVVRDYFFAYEYRLPAGRLFGEIFRGAPARITLPQEIQGEAIAYRRDGRALLTTSEGRPTPLHELLPAGH